MITLTKINKKEKAINELVYLCKQMSVEVYRKPDWDSLNIVTLQFGIDEAIKEIEG